MADETKKPEAAPLQIQASDEIARGRYSNNMVVTHTPEEFLIDWLLTAPNGTQLISRIILSPGHTKRVVSALVDNLQKFEKKYGDVPIIEPGAQQFH